MDSLSKEETLERVAKMQQADLLHRGAQMMHHALKKNEEIDPELAQFNRKIRRSLKPKKKKTVRF